MLVTELKTPEPIEFFCNQAGETFISDDQHFVFVMIQSPKFTEKGQFEVMHYTVSDTKEFWDRLTEVDFKDCHDLDVPENAVIELFQGLEIDGDLKMPLKEINGDTGIATDCCGNTYNFTGGDHGYALWNEHAAFYANDTHLWRASNGDTLEVNEKILIVKNDSWELLIDFEG